MWAKITGFMGLVIAALLTFISFRSKKIEKLEHKEKVNETIKEIRKAQDEVKEKILEKEKERINEAVNKDIPNNNNTSKRDRLNSL